MNEEFFLYYKAYDVGAKTWQNNTGETVLSLMSQREIQQGQDIYATAFADGAKWQREQIEMERSKTTNA